MPNDPAESDNALLGWLEHHDAPCPVCSYNLRGVPRAVCPECGAELQRSVGSTHLRLGPWLFAVVTIALGRV